MSTERPLLRRTLLVLLSSALAVALLEVASSAALHVLRSGPDPPADLATAVRLEDYDVPVEPDPFLRYTMRANARSAEYSTNEHGLRNASVSLSRPAATFRVLLLGGSTAWGYSSRSNEDTLSVRLERQLSERKHELGSDVERVEVLNAAVPGYVARQNALAFGTDRYRLEPNIVVSLDGANEVHAAILTRGAGNPMDDRRFEPKPSLTGSFRRWLGYRVERSKTRQLLDLLFPPSMGERGAPSPRNVATSYARAQRILADLSQPRGAQLLAVLQPMSVLAGTKALTEFERETAEAYDASMPGRNAYYDACYEAMRSALNDLAAEHSGIVGLDATGVFADTPETAFIDHCHLSPLGRDVLATWLTEQILAHARTAD